MKIERFTHEEIPYDILNKFNLTHEMIDDLPENITKRMLAGCNTPLLPVITETVTGEKVLSFNRIRLVRMKDGDIDIRFTPKWMDEDMKEYSEEEQEKLHTGMVIITDRPKKGKCYVQYDETIAQVLVVPEEIIRHNIMVYARQYEIDDKQIEGMLNGEIIETIINANDKKITLTAGVDLKEETGLRLVQGDTLEWRNDANVEKLPKYNFGLYGCWIADEENTLSYVYEDDYTEEINEEMRRKGSQEAAKQNMQQMKVL